MPNMSQIQSLGLVSDVSWNFQAIVKDGKPIPVVALTMETSNGAKQVLLDLPAFHRLRYSTAQYFKDMLDLQNRIDN